MVFQPKVKKTVTFKDLKKTQLTTPKASKRVVKMYKTITVEDLASQIKIKNHALIKKLKKEGLQDITIDTPLDHDTVSLISPEFGFEVQSLHQNLDEVLKAVAFGKLDAKPVIRPPVVTVMGHVDHGKTTLLDALRNTDLVKKEAGGITQHIGAYTVLTKNKKNITFIDTPGHQAFTAMRERGAHVTDIVILVVAADDGVMPQTVEALNHAKASGAPIIVAVNKIDAPNANSEKIKQQLSEYELLPEDWGGQTTFCEVSALQKKGLDNLLEHIELLAEVLELKTNPEQSADGVVIESRLEKGKGAVVTFLVKNGTLHKGDALVVGDVTAKVRLMIDDKGKSLNHASCAQPVEVTGFETAPQVGEHFYVCKSEKDAQKIADLYKESGPQSTQPKDSSDGLDIFSKLQEQKSKSFLLLLKLMWQEA